MQLASVAKRPRPDRFIGQIVVRIGRNTSFGRVMLLGAHDRPVGMVASAYSMM